MRLYPQGVLVFLSLLCLVEGSGQSPSNPLPPGYYIVVAAYKLNQDAYAQTYISRISKEGVTAKYGADVGRKYLYVYLDYFTDFDTSIEEMLSTRQKTGFDKAWVRIMKDELGANVNPIAQGSATPSKPDGTATPNEPAQASAPPDPPIQKESDNVVTEVSPAEEKNAEDLPTQPETPVENETEPITAPKPVSEATVLLSLFNSTNNKPVDGEVEIVDSDRARLISKVKGNEFTTIPDPKSKTGKVNLIANIFGYRPIQHDIYFGQVAHDSVEHFMEWAGNHYVIKFDLVRSHRGDIQTLYNVYFYNDAAIMLPESKYQLNNLLAMMNENPNYRIMLHGHTNGNSRGRIVTMGPSKSFFSLTDDVKDGTGSAKELSKERAEVIKQWLMSQGIAEDRVEIKAWGGGRMLHDKNSVNAKRNVRVDVEILEE